MQCACKIFFAISCRLSFNVAREYRTHLTFRRFFATTMSHWLYTYIISRKVGASCDAPKAYEALELSAMISIPYLCTKVNSFCKKKREGLRKVIEFILPNLCQAPFRGLFFYSTRAYTHGSASFSPRLRKRESNTSASSER